MHKQQTKIRWWLLVATAIAALALPALAGATTTLSHGASVGMSPLSHGASVGISPFSHGASVGTAPLSTRVAGSTWH